MKKIILRMVLAMALCAALLAVSAVTWLPSVIKTQVAKAVQKELGRPFSLGELTINPVTLQVHAGNIALFEQDGKTPFVELKNLDAKLSWASVWRLAPVVNQVAVDGLVVNIVRLGDNNFNFSDIVQKLAAKPPSAPAKFAIYNITLSQGKLAVDDRVALQQHTVKALELNVPFISSLAHDAEVFVTPKLHMLVNDQPFKLDGQTKPFSKTYESVVQLNWQNVAIKPWMAYSPVPLPFTLRDGRLSTALEITFKQSTGAHAGATPQLSVRGDASIAQLSIEEKNNKSPSVGQKTTPIEFAAFEIKGFSLEPFAQKLGISSVLLKSPSVVVKRDAQGQVNVQNLLKFAPSKTVSASTTKPAAAAAPWAVQLGTVAVEQGQLSWEDEGYSPALKVRAQGITIGAQNIQWPQAAGATNAATLKADLSVGEVPSEPAPRLKTTKSSPLSIDAQYDSTQTAHARIKLQGVDLHTLMPLLKQHGLSYDLAGHAALDAQLKYSPTGELSTPQSTLNLAQLVVSAANAQSAASPLKIDKASVQLTSSMLLPQQQLGTAVQLDMPNQSYAKANGSIKIAKDAPLAMQLKLDVSAIDVLPILGFAPQLLTDYNVQALSSYASAKGELNIDGNVIQWKGASSIDKVHVVDADAQDLVKLGRLAAQGMSIATGAGSMKLNLGQLTLQDGFGKAILNAQGKLNLSNLNRKNDKTTPASTVPSAAPEITVDGIIIVNTAIAFTDNFIKPNYHTNLSQLTGTIGAMSSTNPAPADVVIKGNIEGSGDLNVNGKINPLSSTLYADINAKATGIELTQLSPYSAKYADYNIIKGKLSADVTYAIEQGKLKASNKIKIDQLTFGDAKIGSPDATGLPVRLAVALLKDRHGVIDIDLPITGSLNDPQFSVGKLVWQVLGNLIVKAVTAPFALLGSLFGGGESLSYVDFPAGGAVPDAAVKKKLDILAKAMTERPGLSLEIIGRSDESVDTEGLRTKRYEELLRTAKVKALLKNNKSTNSADVTLQASDEALYIEDVYKEASFPKPKNMLGLSKSIPIADMRKLLLTHIAVSNDDVKALAAARASAAQSYLQTTIDKSRLFVVVASEGKPPKDAKPSRVDFVLK